jgi:hypothetical protein
MGGRRPRSSEAKRSWATAALDLFGYGEDLVLFKDPGELPPTIFEAVKMVGRRCP